MTHPTQEDFILWENYNKAKMNHLDEFIKTKEKCLLDECFKKGVVTQLMQETAEINALKIMELL